MIVLAFRFVLFDFFAAWLGVSSESGGLDLFPSSVRMVASDRFLFVFPLIFV